MDFQFYTTDSTAYSVFCSLMFSGGPHQAHSPFSFT